MLSTIYLLDPPGDSLLDLKKGFGLKAPECELVLVSSVPELQEVFKDDRGYRLVVVHESHGDGEHSGLALISEIRALDSEVPVVVVADSGSVEGAAKAIEAGANDYLVRGAHLNERISTLLQKLKGLFQILERNRELGAQNEDLRQTVQAQSALVGESPQVRSLIQQIHRVGPVPRPLLIVGERGTGKELVARAIHLTVGLESRPIVTVNCAAFTDALLESELFGHERGAFTGAESTRIGKFEQAKDGTLFLDEIGHMSLPFQQKILRVVEYGTFTRVGGTKELRTEARVIAATNSDLKEKMKKGEFLPDLYDRIGFEVIKVPPLREREGDVEVLARHFLNQFAREIPAFRGKGAC